MLIKYVKKEIRSINKIAHIVFLPLISQKNDEMADKKGYKFTPATINPEFGKVPPQAVELEEAVLGALMLEKDAVLTVLDILSPESFYRGAHQKIFKAVLDLSTKLEAIDLLTVTEELRKKGQLEEIGGPYYITQLTSRVASAAHVEFHARIISQKYIQRELIRVSTDIQTKAFDSSIDVLELLNYSEESLFQIAEGNIKKETVAINGIIQIALEQIQEAGKKEDGLSGCPSGFSAMDRITNGWQPSDLVIIAARPSMGKTAFVLSMARNIAATHKRGVAFFSLEMSSLQLVNRLIASETELGSEKIRSGRLEPYEWQQLESKIENIVDAPLFIDDTPAISIFELRAKCRRLKMQHNIEIIIIDYLQLMTAGDKNQSREQEVSMISRSLKAIAKELNVAIMALSQLNRSVETRGGDKRPQLSDLRESGAIEQDADMVCFIHRPEYYGIDTDEDGNSLIGIGEIIISKHRNGALGTIPLKFEKNLARFVELDSDILGLPPEINEGQVFGSKMNAEPATAGGDDFMANTNFENEAPF